MTAIHQFVPSLAPRDAVGTHYLAIQESLRATGISSDIYAYEAKAEFSRRALPFMSFDGARKGEPTWLMYHSSIGSPVADFVRRRSEPVIVDYHNITPESFFARWEPVVTANLMKGRRQLADLQPRSSLGIGDSSFNASELRSLGYSPTAVVPILLDVHALGAAAPDPSVRRASATTWLFVGRLAPNKAQHDLVKGLVAYRRFYDPDARLVLVGGSSSHRYKTTLERFIAELGLRDAVTLTDAVTPEQLSAHYRNADVFVAASEHEGFCVPLLEAMHHDLPIVAYGAAAIPETVDTAALLLDEKDACSLAAGVHRVITDATLRASLIAAGESRLEELDIRQSRQKLLDAVLPVVAAAA
jgi:glycosyltransferase involved in cell wall biosynthesis